MLTTREAARLVGRGDTLLRLAIARGTLPAENINGRWFIAETDLRDWDLRTRRYPRQATSLPVERAAAMLREYESLSAEELATLAHIHPGNARKHLALLATQGRAERRPDGQWVLTTDSAGRRLAS